MFPYLHLCHLPFSGDWRQRTDLPRHVQLATSVHTCPGQNTGAQHATFLPQYRGRLSCHGVGLPRAPPTWPNPRPPLVSRAYPFSFLFKNNKNQLFLSEGEMTSSPHPVSSVCFLFQHTCSDRTSFFKTANLTHKRRKNASGSVIFASKAVTDL